MIVYAFWNNKGGTGKTSLAFQTICSYADKNKDKKILAVDACPQANISELFLGGLNNGSSRLLERQGTSPRCTIGGYFQLRLPKPFQSPEFTPEDFITTPEKYNKSIPKNIDLLCGDPLLELQSNAINTLANAQIPGTDTWLAVIDWLKDFFDKIENDYDVVFIDANPSFSIYTQIALATANRLILPVMADDSSRRAILNAFSLVYGLKLPSDIYTKYAFGTKLKDAKRPLPKVHIIAKNRITQYMGSASAYAAVLETIEQDVSTLIKTNSIIFTFNKVEDGFVEIRDFQTTGVIAFSKGNPFFNVQDKGKINVAGRRVTLHKEYRDNCISAIDSIVSKL